MERKAFSKCKKNKSRYKVFRLSSDNATRILPLSSPLSKQDKTLCFFIITYCNFYRVCHLQSPINLSEKSWCFLTPTLWMVNLATWIADFIIFDNIVCLFRHSHITSDFPTIQVNNAGLLMEMEDRRIWWYIHSGGFCTSFNSPLSLLFLPLYCKISAG